MVREVSASRAGHRCSRLKAVNSGVSEWLEQVFVTHEKICEHVLFPTHPPTFTPGRTVIRKAAWRMIFVQSTHHKVGSELHAESIVSRGRGVTGFPTRNTPDRMLGTKVFDPDGRNRWAWWETCLGLATFGIWNFVISPPFPVLLQHRISAMV